MLLEKYIPEEAQRVEIKEELKLEIFKYTDNKGKVCAIAYAGRSKKPIWHYSFANEQRREDRISDTISSYEASLKFKAERKAAAKARKEEFIKSLKMGDILYSTWGYEQTNVDFYQVTYLKGSTVEITPIAQELVESTGMDQGEFMPCKDQFAGDPIKKRISSDSIKLTSYSWASKWNGQKIWGSWYY